MRQNVLSAIKRFKEENEIPVDNEPDIAEEDSVSSLSNSQLRDIIKQEIDNSRNKDSKSDTPDKQSSSDFTPPTQKKSFPKPATVPHNNPEIKLPSKSKKRSHPRKTNAMWPYNKPQPYTELQPVNIYPKTKDDLILFRDKRIKELLEDAETDICFISPLSNSSYVTPDANVRRCHAFIEMLKKNDYLYFPVYLYDTSIKQITSVVFMVFKATVKTINLKRTFDDMFDLITEFSWKYAIKNFVYWTRGQFVLRKSREYSDLNLNSSEEVIMYLCGLNQIKVTRYCQLMVNPFCSSKMEYLQRHISENELCVVM